MKRPSRKQLLWTGVAVLFLAALIYGFLPDPVMVQGAVVERGPLRVVIEEEGATRVTDRYVVAAPVAAYLRRLAVEPGDLVQAGQPLAQLEPPRAADLDVRSRQELAGRVDAARAAVAAQAEQARAAGAFAEQAAAERDRLVRLAAAEAATPQALERAEAEVARAVASRDAAQAGVAAARADLATAQATLGPVGGGAPVRQTLTAPASGRVLAVHRRDAGPVSPGEPLLEIGDTGALEVQVDVLSQDAVRIPHGGRVLFEQWGGDTVLEGVVQRVEPRAFTRVSALGVEEQRVPVIATIQVSAEAGGLGSGYRVLARFVIWEAEDVLQVPTGALFRMDGGWAVFVIEGGRAVRRAVAVGRQTGLSAQVMDGLVAGDVVIVHPASELGDGTRVRRR
jgi:HlyD family secretion protein